jgi:hypothetical protein
MSHPSCRALAAFAAGVAPAQGKHDHKPLHGVVVTEVGDIDIELVAKADVVIVYVRDHGKPISTQGATGKITLLSGMETTEAPLAPAGDNRLEAKGAFKVGAGTKAVATVTLAGKKPLTARFALK